MSRVTCRGSRTRGGGEVVDDEPARGGVVDDEPARRGVVDDERRDEPHDVPSTRTRGVVEVEPLRPGDN
jgi:hypothetical protein